MALKKPKEVVNMIHLGYRYTERLSKTEAFRKTLLTTTDSKSISDVESVGFDRAVNDSL